MQNTAPVLTRAYGGHQFLEAGRSTNPEPERPSSSITVTEANRSERADSATHIVAAGFPCAGRPGPWSTGAHRPPHRGRGAQA